MDIERLLDKFGPNFDPPHKLSPTERREVRNQVEPVWKRYIDMPITLQIDDPEIVRLCQVLTNLGHITFSSCAGKLGVNNPHVYFTHRNVNEVARLSATINRTAISNFHWTIEVGYRDSLRTGYYKAFYILAPQQLRREGTCGLTQSARSLWKPGSYREDLRYAELFREDFDILGYSIFDDFMEE